PPALAEVLAAAMAKDPDRRPGTAADLGRRLQEVQSSAGVPVTDLRLAPPGGDERRGPDSRTGPSPPPAGPAPGTSSRTGAVARTMSAGTTARDDRAPAPPGADPSPTRSLRRPPAGDPTPTVRGVLPGASSDDDTAGDPDPGDAAEPATPDRRWNVWAPVLALTGVAAVLSWVGVWFTDSSPCCSGFSRGDFERLPDLALLGVVLAAVGGVLTALRREVPWWGRLGVAVITLLVVAAWLHVLWEFDDRVLPFYEPDDGEAIGWGAWVSALIPLTAAPGLVLLALDVRRPRSPGSPR
ncbi:MAG: hypothetical protein KDB10_24435, partial [Acidimicrobiales bacterium]|nr:hypothetical protein [Acidimicrobiales bacterium]